MIIRFELTNANIFDQKVDAMVNPVNCVGVMGGGLALEFKKRNKTHFEIYKKMCDEGKFVTGKVYFYHISDIIGTNYVIDFPTKNHWKDPSKIEYISEGMDDLVFKIPQYDIKSIAIPALGCGLGGLDWKEVRPIIVDRLFNVETDLDVILLKTD
jgi:O-acetyl-ADP-ribose deacetylase (regulator of RNase III)